jgi:integrase
VALTREEEARVVEAISKRPFSVRDRLLVELLLACGLRVSELCALLVDDLHLTNRPPYLHVRGSVHDRDRTKNGEDRSVPFRSTYNTLPRRLEAFIATERDPEGTADRRELFLSRRKDASGRLLPLTTWGVEELMQRLSTACGIHCNPHKMRHTFATRSVDAGIPIFHLQQAGGWRSIEMVRRYYTADTREVLESYENAHLG